MADSVYHRRQPPSPLVFTPDTVLSPIPIQAQTSNASSHSSGSNTVSMPFVRRHVTRRLKAAKTECDKELQRVTNNITAFFEEKLREGDHETERELRDRERDRDSQAGDIEHLRDAFVHQTSEFGVLIQPDEYSSDGGYEAEVEYSRHSRQRAYPDDDSARPAPSLSHSNSLPGLTASAVSQASPSSLRRQNTAPWDRPLSSSMSSSAISGSPASSTGVLPDAPLTRKPTNPGAPTSWSSGGAASRRLSRTIHMPSRPTQSGHSSRSTSRSRSPLPPLSMHTSFSEYSALANRRSSRILVDDPVDPIMTALYDIIGVATDITEMSIAQLTAQSKICETLVQRVQNIGKTWDDHPDWHGRNWYVQVLLAVASLSRVVEWWEAEKQFWNFDENEDEQDEPLTFVTKPVAEMPVSPPSRHTASELDNFKLNPEDEHKHRLTRPTSQSRRSRDEHPKDLSLGQSLMSRDHPDSQSRASPAKLVENTESARVLATERLRLQAETAQNQNIVMELSLDGDHFLWVNHAWRVVIGYVYRFIKILV